MKMNIVYKNIENNMREITTLRNIKNGITKIRRKSKEPNKLGNCLSNPN